MAKSRGLDSEFSMRVRADDLARLEVIARRFGLPRNEVARRALFMGLAEIDAAGVLQPLSPASPTRE